MSGYTLAQKVWEPTFALSINQLYSEYIQKQDFDLQQATGKLRTWL